MVAHEKRNSAQLFCAVPTQNDFALSSLLFSAHPTQKLGYPYQTLGICVARGALLRRGKRGYLLYRGHLQTDCPLQAP